MISLKCDASGIQRIMENLVTNAVKYGSPDTIITIKIERFNSLAYISVHNLGNPIQSVELQDLFEAFHRVKTTI